MKHLMTLIALVVAVTAGAQEWNPDSNSDGIIGVEDLMGLLSAFGMEWNDALQIQVVDTLMDAEGQIQFETFWSWGSNSVYGENFVELTIHDTSDVVIFNDFHVMDNALFQGTVDDVDYNSGDPVVRTILPSSVSQKCIVFLFDDPVDSGESEWLFKFFEGESVVWEFHGQQRAMTRACSVGGKWFFTQGGW